MYVLYIFVGIIFRSLIQFFSLFINQIDKFALNIYFNTLYNTNLQKVIMIAHNLQL